MELLILYYIGNMFKTILTALTFATIFTASLSAQNIKFEDNFDLENNSIGELNYENLTNWNIPKGSIDLKGNGFYDFYPNNGLYLDLDGTTLLAGRLESKQIFNFSKGDKVDFSFDILGQNIQTGFENNFIDVSLGDLFLETFDLGDTGTNSIKFTMPSDLTANIVFAHKGGDNGGLILDNIKLTSTSIREIPEYFSFIPYALISFLFVKIKRK